MDLMQCSHFTVKLSAGEKEQAEKDLELLDPFESDVGYTKLFDVYKKTRRYFRHYAVPTKQAIVAKGKGKRASTEPKGPQTKDMIAKFVYIANVSKAKLGHLTQNSYYKGFLPYVNFISANFVTALFLKIFNKYLPYANFGLFISHI